VLDYDFVVLLAGIAFLWRDAERHGWLPWEKSALALVWLAPLIARNLAALTLFPLGLLAAMLVLVLAVRRATQVRSGGSCVSKDRRPARSKSAPSVLSR
jgi:alpha-1,2-mannosyltransferase